MQAAVSYKGHSRPTLPEQGNRPTIFIEVVASLFYTILIGTPIPQESLAYLNSWILFMHLKGGILQQSVGLGIRTPIS